MDVRALVVVALCLCCPPADAPAQVLPSIGGTVSLPTMRADAIFSQPVVVDGRPDLFRAGPETYVPWAGRRLALPDHGLLGGVAGYPPFVVSGQESQRRSRLVRRSKPTKMPSRRIALAPTRSRRATALIEPQVEVAREVRSVPALVRKPFYIIAGCYAGDSPPRAELLPEGCDGKAVRVIQGRGAL